MLYLSNYIQSKIVNDSTSKMGAFYIFHVTLLLHIIALFQIQLQLFAALRLYKFMYDFAYVPVEYSFDTLME